MESLGNIKVPVMLVHGEHDYIDPDLATRARDLLPGSHLAFFEGCSHMPFFEKPALYLNTLQKFLERNWNANEPNH